MTSVFISYRRGDASGHAGRLSDRLVARFGPERVFMDVSDIQPGQNFEQAIERTLGQCDHVLAVIGPRWLSLLEARQAAGEDFVRSEIGAALAHGATVIPVLVGGAEMPRAAQLPAELRGLAKCQAVKVEDDAFDAGAARLVTFLAEGAPTPEAGAPGGGVSRRAVVAASLVIIAVVLAAAWGLWPARVTERATAVSTAGDTPAEEPALDINGDWIAELQKPGQPAFRVRLTLARSGEQVIGTVRYPTGDAAIVDGRYTGGQLTFHTSHVPQFASTPVTIRVQGRVEGSSMSLTAADDTGVAAGRAQRAPASPDR